MNVVNGNLRLDYTVNNEWVQILAHNIEVLSWGFWSQRLSTAHYCECKLHAYILATIGPSNCAKCPCRTVKFYESNYHSTVWELPSRDLWFPFLSLHVNYYMGKNGEFFSCHSGFPFLSEVQHSHVYETVYNTSSPSNRGSQNKNQTLSRVWKLVASNPCFIRVFSPRQCNIWLREWCITKLHFPTCRLIE